MSALHLPPCAENISEQTLSDWHDGLLNANEALHLRNHAASCPACRFRAEGFVTVATALRRQHIPDLQWRIRRGISANMGRKPAQMTQRVATLGVVSAVLLVALAAIFAYLPKHPGTPPTSFIPTATQGSTVTPQPTNGPNLLTPQQAWGTAGIHTLSIDTQKYSVQGLFPGGAGVVATTYTQTSQTNPADFRDAIVYITTADAKVHVITVGAWTHARVATDGRYIAWLGGYNPTGGPGDSRQTLAYYDLQTGQTHTIVDVDFNYFDAFQAFVVTHGHLIITQEEINPPVKVHALMVIDLATSVQQTYLNQVNRFAASWPYVLVDQFANATIKDTPDFMTLINMQTGQQRDVTSLVDFINLGEPNFALDGTTIFAAHAEASHTTEGYYQIDHADQANPQQRELFREPLKLYPSIDDAFTGADARLLSLKSDTLSFAIWDRVLQRPIDTGTLFMFDNGVVAYSASQGQPIVLTLQDESNFRS